MYWTRAKDKNMGNVNGKGHGVGTLARACHVARTWDNGLGQSHGKGHETRVCGQGHGAGHGIMGKGRG